MKEPLRMLAVILALALVFVQCSPDDPRRPKPQAVHQLDSLNALMFKELTRGRVVMFADAYAGHITYSRCVTSFLKSWLDRLQQTPSDTGLPRNLALALELGQSGEKVLNEYMKTGDRYLLMRFLIDEQAKFNFDKYLTRQLSADYLEFCEGLREVRARIDSLNVHHPGLAVSLDILGPEPEPPYSYLDVQRRPQREFYALKSHWDAVERDRQTSMRLVDYLARNPSHKLLVFCGWMHLIRDRKDGTFLAHHLDSLVGRPSVSVFLTTRIPRNPLSGPQIEEYKHNNETADFQVYMSAHPPNPFPFFIVKSQNTFRALVDLSERYDAAPDTLTKDMSRKMLAHALELLRRSHVALDPVLNRKIASLQSGVAAATRNAIMASETYADIRRMISHFDAVQDVLEIDSVMTTFAPSQEYYNTLLTLIDNLSAPAFSTSDTVRVVTSSLKQADQLTANWSSMWKNRKSERHTYMLLQILWLGTPDEVAKAKAALERETGRDFKSTSQWEDWWRGNKNEAYVR